MSQTAISGQLYIQAVLRKNECVADCHVSVRQNECGEDVLVAYVVPRDRCESEALSTYASARLPPEMRPAHYVFLTALPYDSDGRLDFEALAAYPVLDAAAAENWAAQLRNRPGVREVAVVRQERRPKYPALHLAELLGDCDPSGAIDPRVDKAAARFVPRASRPLEIRAGGTPAVRRMALADGGPLILPAEAPQTLTEALLRTASRAGNKGVTFIAADGSEIRRTYPALLDDAKRILGGLRAAGFKAGDSAILQIESLADHFAAFWACLLGGITPVTVAVAPSFKESNGVLQKLLNAWKLLGEPRILTNERLVNPIEFLSRVLPGAKFSALAVEKLRAHTPSEQVHQSRPEDVAFFQLTSGSTGVPKCIQETHRSIVSHIHAVRQFNGLGPDDVTLNWLPADHVAPILTYHLKDTYIGCDEIQVKTEAVLANPLKWLDLLEAHRVTHSWSPNFGYKLVTEALAKSSGRSWDLHSLKFLMNGGEQATLPVIREFLRATAPSGVAPRALQFSFGMAEACTCITFQNGFDETQGVFRFLKSSLAGELQPAPQDSPDAAIFVSLGPPTPGTQLRIVDRNNQLLPEGAIGRMQLKGTVVTPGYFRNDEANRAAFTGDGWFDSGDLGFILNGSLAITGREKEMIVVRGANFHCHEIEDVAGRVKGVKPTCAAACAVRDPASGTEALAIFFVPEAENADGHPALARAIRTRVSAALGIAPEHVIPLEPGEFPKTTSGKIQRGQLKEALESGKFAARLRALDVALENERTLPAWFMRETWVRKTRTSADPDAPLPSALIFADAKGLGQALAARLHAIVVEPGRAFAQSAPHHFRIDPANPEHYRRLLAAVRECGHALAEILHLWTYGADAGQSAEFYSVLFLAQALAHENSGRRPVRLHIISSRAQRVLPEDEVSCERAMLPGLVKTLPKEFPWLSCAQIDIDGGHTEEALREILPELTQPSGDHIVALRKNQRWVAALQPVKMLAQPPRPGPLKPGGVYLITGGLGGVGVEVARCLLEKFHARVLLTGRTPLPPRRAWPKLLESGQAPQKLRALLELEKLPGEAAYACADAADFGALSAALVSHETRWQRPLDGVFHLAGVYRERLLLEETRQSFEETLRPKLHGARVLAELLRTRPGALFVSFGSAVSALGGTASAAYACANGALKAFDESLGESLPHWCLSWSAWDDIGMSREIRFTPAARAAGYLPLNAVQGTASLLAALRRGPRQMLIGLDPAHPQILRETRATAQPREELCAYYSGESAARNLEMFGQLEVRDAFGRRCPCRLARLDALPRGADGGIDRQELARSGGIGRTNDTAPRNDLERKVAEIWRKHLRGFRAGIHDNFFEAGGNSLVAAQLLYDLEEACGAELPLHCLFEAPTIAGLAELLAQDRQRTPPPENLPQIVARPDAEQYEPFPLTAIQQAYWLGRGNSFELGRVGCHVYVEMDFAELDVERFSAVVQQLLARHPMLRAIVRPDGRQQILEDVPAHRIAALDLRGQTPASRNAQLSSLRRIMSHDVLAAERAPLFEIRAALLDGDAVRLHLSFDMLIADARSFQILMQEASQLYDAPEKRLPELSLTFRDYVLALEAFEKSGLYTRSRDYWLARLETLPSAPELPLAKSPSAVALPRFARRSLRLPGEEWSKLKARAARAGLTPSSVLLAAYAEVLALWSKNPRFSLNLTLFNRLPLHPQVNEIVGDFTSSILLAVSRASDETFEKRARRIQAQLWNDFDHRHFDGVRVMRELARTHTATGASGLMPVVFTSVLDLPGRPRAVSLAQRGKLVHGISQTPQVWLDNQALADGDGLSNNWDAIEELFPPGLLDEMFAAYSRLLTELCGSEKAWQATWPQTTSRLLERQLAERVRINATAAPVPRRLLHTLFTGQAARRPLQPALVCGARTLTYRELDALTNRYGRLLRKNGARPNQLVAIVMRKGWEQAVAALSILKSGAAYLPLDPALPPERLAHLFKHGEVALALTTPDFNESLAWPEGLRRFCVQADFAGADASPLKPVQTSRDLAYVIYTSGSTGQPKGVAIDHRGAVNTLVDLNRRFAVRPADRVLALSALNFDLSVYDLFGLLAAGGTVVLPEFEESRDPAHWLELLRAQRITIWNTVPALMQLVAEQAERAEADLRSLRLVMLSGDWIPVNLPGRIRARAPDAQLFSLGGATEASIWSILYPIGKIDPGWKSIPYGRPLANQSFHVLDETLTPCAAWVPGQLFIGGIGLARGYWRDEEKTAKSFIVHPRTGERLYRTGDLGRFLPDGNIEFLGREDFQVKINGFRIELGEIETALEQHPAVQAAVVAAVGERAQKRLIGYVIPRPGAQAGAETLRAHLKTKLPEYMVPSVFVRLESLPLSANGKVNRKALPPPEENAAHKRAEFVAPRTALESVLTRIMSGLLQTEKLGVEDNFFELGGHSLLAFQLLSQLRDTLEVEAAPNAIFDAPTVARLAGTLLRQSPHPEQLEKRAGLLLEVATGAGGGDCEACPAILPL